MFDPGVGGAILCRIMRWDGALGKPIPEPLRLAQVEGRTGRAWCM